MEKVAIGKFDFDGYEWRNVSKEAKNLICNLLAKNPENRFSAEEAISDYWIEKNNTKREIDIPMINTALDNLRTFKVLNFIEEFIKFS